MNGSRIRIATLTLALIACTKEGDVLRERATPPLPNDAFTTSWLGNSFARSAAGEPQWLSFSLRTLAVSATGIVRVHGPFDHGGHELNILKDGALIGFAPDLASLEGGSGALACGANDFCYHGVGTYTSRAPGSRPPQGFRRIRADGSSIAGSSELYLREGDHDIAALAVNATQLFVADRSTGQLRVFVAKTMTQTNAVDLPDVLALTTDANGDVWVAQAPSVQAPSQSVRLLHLDKQSQKQVKLFDLGPAQVPRSLAFDRDGSLLMADDGPDQNVKRLDVSVAALAPRLIGTLGQMKGIFAPPIGRVGAARFHHPVTVGVDGFGNVFVGTNGGGASIEAFTPQGDLKWRAQGLVRVTGAAVDPQSDRDLFTMNQHFEFSYDDPPGSNWKYVGYTVDPNRFPDDPRLALASDSEAPFVRWLEGRRFLFQGDTEAKALRVFRFDDPKLSETAIPVAMFATGRMDGIPNQPAAGAWLWTDVDGMGDFDADEFENWNSGDAPIDSWFVDSVGSVWLSRREAGIDQIPRATTGRYDLNALKHWPVPRGLSTVRRALYDAQLDRLLVAGSGAELPDIADFKSIGTQVYAFDEFSTLAPRLMPGFPWTFAAVDQIQDQVVQGIEWGSGFVFLARRTSKELCTVYELATGRAVQTIQPGPAVGAVGSQLITRQSFTVHARPNSDFVITRPDQNHGKILLARFRGSPPHR